MYRNKSDQSWQSVHSQRSPEISTPCFLHLCQSVRNLHLKYIINMNTQVSCSYRYLLFGPFRVLIKCDIYLFPHEFKKDVSLMHYGKLCVPVTYSFTTNNVICLALFRINLGLLPNFSCTLVSHCLSSDDSDAVSILGNLNGLTPPLLRLNNRKKKKSTSNLIFLFSC